MKGRPLALGTSIGLCCLLLAGPALAVTIEFVPAAQSVSLGGAVAVDLLISELGGGVAPSLGTFDLDVSFDPTVLTATDVAFGPFLGDPLLVEALTGFSFALGVFDFFELSFLLPSELDALQPDSFVLATLFFDAVGPGTSSLVISDAILGDAFGDPLSANLSTGSVTVTQATIAAPGAIWLLAPALFLLLHKRSARRRR